MRTLQWHHITRALVGATTALCICAGITGIAAAATSTYSRAGVFQTLGDLPRDWKTPYQLIDGIPLVDYGAFVARNPVTAAQFGLANYSLWLRYHAAYRWRIARHVADWLAFTQRPDGK